MGIAYAMSFWGALTYQKHEEWAASLLDGATMSDSEAESQGVCWSLHHGPGNGGSLTLSAMFENVEYEFNNTTTPGAALQDFGFSSSTFAGGTANTDVTIDRDAFLISGKYARWKL